VQDLRSNAISKEDQPPSFLRLESLIVVKPLLLVNVPNVDIIKVAEHLLQNTTPMPRVDIIGTL